MSDPATPARTGERGMTLIELMIAMVILGVVITSAFSVAFSIMNGYREHRRAIAVERSARGAMAVLTEAVRNASPGVPDGNIIDLIGCETDWHGIRVENSSTAPDSLDVVYAAGGVVSSLRQVFNEASIELRIEDGSLLRPGDQVLVTDFEKGHLLAVQDVRQSAPDWIVELAGAPTSLCAGVAAFSYEPRTTVLKVQKARFFIDDGGVNRVPSLSMDPDGPTGQEAEPVAEGIEDLQIAIGIDRDGDGGIGKDQAGSGDDDDWVFNHPSDTAPLDIAVKPYRAIRITVVARSIADTSQTPVSKRPAAEDRPGAAAPDELRRRSLSATIEIRNLEGSP